MTLDLRFADTTDCKQAAAADVLQPPLVPRFGFQTRLSRERYSTCFPFTNAIAGAGQIRYHGL